MSEPRVVGCPLCGSPVEASGDAPRLTCGICSSVILLQNGEPVLETDLQRLNRRQGKAEAPDVQQTAPDIAVEQTSPDVPIEQQTSPDVPIEQQTSPDVPIEQQTAPGTALPPPPDLDSPAPTTSPLDARAFQGSLANLSIVDVLQLLYSSQKTGVLELTGAGMKASITLLEGHIIGCEHPTQGTQIGQTLVESGAVTQQDVDEALAKQDEAGDNRLPLVSTLITMGKINEQAGWHALEKLAESTVIHVLGWVGGSFVFEVSDVTAFDDFRHLATGVSKVGLDTQTTLLGTLKAIDENGHSGDDADPDASLLDGLDAAFAEPAPGEPKVIAATETVELDDADVEELDHDTEEIGVAPSKSPKRELPAPLVQVLERIRQTPPKLLAAAGGGLLLIVIIIIVAVSLSGAEPDEPVTTDTEATEATESDPEPTEPAEPADPEPAVEPEPGTEPVIAADDDVGATKVKRTKRKRKRKRKGKDARSLFDAAVK